MYCKQNLPQEQVGFTASRLLHQKMPEKNPARPETEAKPEVLTHQEKIDKMRAELADFSLSLGIEKPMKEMMAIERSLKTPDQKSEFTFMGEKLTVTLENNQPVWRNENNEVIEKAVWLKEKTDNSDQKHKKNLGKYWTEVSKKYTGTDKEKAEVQKGIDKNLQLAENEDIEKLQKDWDKAKMSQMFLGRQIGKYLTFEVNFQGKDKFENYIGAGHILPATVTEISVKSKNGDERIGTRQVQNGRIGYFDEKGYIPVFSGDKITILKTSNETSEDVKTQEKKETDTKAQMRGTIWHKKESAPTEVTPHISQKTGYRYETVGGKKVEVKPPKPDDKIYEASKPEQTEKIETPETKGGYFKFGKERVYIEAPKSLEGYKGQPEVIFYAHGNGSNIPVSLEWMKKEVDTMRKQGRPVILVIPENRLGNWQDFQKPGAFGRLMQLVDETSGMPGAKITISGHSGGYEAMQNILRDGELNDRIETLAIFDAAYGNSPEVFKEFAKDPSKKLRSVFTDHLAEKNQRMMKDLIPGVQATKEDGFTVWRDESGRFEFRTAPKPTLTHGSAARKFFTSFLS